MGEEKNRRKTLTRKTKGSRKIGHMFREENNIKMYLKWNRWEIVDCIYVVQEAGRRRAVLVTVTSREVR